MERFIPDGYVTTEIAVLLLAKRQNPDIWEAENIPPTEFQSLWLSINVRFSGVVLGPALIKELGVAFSEETLARLISFEAALSTLRQLLYRGAARAFHVDELGEFVRFEPNCWGQKLADEALVSGKATVGDPATEQVILIETSTLARSSLPPQSAPPKAPVTYPVRWAAAPAIREAFAVRFREWPEGEPHPSEPDDIAALEHRLGKRINRKVFRPIRREIAPDWTSRGRSRKGKTAEK